MGLRRRVSFGFMSIVGVLILSGMVSFFELNNLSNDTEDILGSNRKYRLFLGEMMDALRVHNDAIINVVAFDDKSYDSLCVSSLNRLDYVLVQARAESLVPEVVDTLMMTSGELRRVTEELLYTPRGVERKIVSVADVAAADSLSGDVPATAPVAVGVVSVDLYPSDDFVQGKYLEYKTLLKQMIKNINNYFDESQRSLTPGTEQLHNNAYRAVTPVLISLIVMIAIVLMLYFFMMLYCVRPVVKMNNALRDYIAFKVPYAPKGERRDEMHELNERIETLIKQSKNPKSSINEA